MQHALKVIECLTASVRLGAHDVQSLPWMHSVWVKKRVWPGAECVEYSLHEWCAPWPEHSQIIAGGGGAGGDGGGDGDTPCGYTTSAATEATGKSMVNGAAVTASGAAGRPRV